MNGKFRSAIAAFGTDAKAKLANRAATGQPEDQLRSPLDRLIGDLAELCGFRRAEVVAVGESSLSDLKFCTRTILGFRSAPGFMLAPRFAG